MVQQKLAGAQPRLFFVTVQSWEGELAEVGLGMASGGSGGYVIYLEWMGKSTSALPTGIC